MSSSGITNSSSEKFSKNVSSGMIPEESSSGNGLHGRAFSSLHCLMDAPAIMLGARSNSLITGAQTKLAQSIYNGALLSPIGLEIQTSKLMLFLLLFHKNQGVPPLHFRKTNSDTHKK